jgi:hypothetical protein
MRGKVKADLWKIRIACQRIREHTETASSGKDDIQTGAMFRDLFDGVLELEYDARCYTGGHPTLAKIL